MRKRNKEVSTPTDRAEPDIPGSQKTFLQSFNIREAFDALSAIAPAFARMALEYLDANLAYYTALVDAQVKTL
jgi:hypothetical protein